MSAAFRPVSVTVRKSPDEEVPVLVIDGEEVPGLVKPGWSASQIAWLMYASVLMGRMIRPDPLRHVVDRLRGEGPTLVGEWTVEDIVLPTEDHP